MALSQSSSLYGYRRSHTCAVTDAGGAKCWGAYSSRQLGDGSTTQRLAPVDVSGLSGGIKAIGRTAVFDKSVLMKINDYPRSP